MILQHLIIHQDLKAKSAFYGETTLIKIESGRSCYKINEHNVYLNAKNACNQN